MTTHFIDSPAIRQPVLADPQYAVQAALSITNGDNPTMSDALSSNSLYSERSIMNITSTSVLKQIAWLCGTRIPVIATRVQRLANNKFVPSPQVSADQHFAEYGMYPEGSIQQCRHEMITEAEFVAWCFEVAGDFIDPGASSTADLITPAILEWCSGGAKINNVKQEVIEGWKHVGLSTEEATERAKKQQNSMRDWLAVKRGKMANVMVAQVARVIDSVKPTEPNTDKLRDIFQKAFDSASMFNNMTEVILIKDMFSEYLGEDPIINEPDANVTEKANRIREDLNKQVEAQAEAEAMKLAQFDPLALAA